MTYVINDVQKQDPGSAFVELFEIDLPGTNAFFHSGLETDLSTIQFRDRTNPGTTRTYTALPIEIDGIELLQRTRKTNTSLPFIMLTGHGNIETAVESMKLGAYDFISKPPDLNRLINSVRNALEKKELVTENKILRQKVAKKYEIIGKSKPIMVVHSMVDKVAKTEARVLITGESGTGKELVAHNIHERSGRNKSPFIEVNCAAIPSELIESELFGHLKGSFTSAVKDRQGKFEAANNGTLFLDEIGDMSLAAQAKVLRALEENKIQRVGSQKDISVDVRVIAATHQNLETLVKSGQFREDLFHRLNVIRIKVPPLRERVEDIPLLSQYFFTRCHLSSHFLLFC